MNRSNSIKNFFTYHSPKKVFKTLTNYNIKHFKKILEENNSRFEWLNNNLEDEFSKTVLNHIISYRKTENFNFLFEIADITFNQYFDECLQFSPNEIFVDCGGFIGDTTQNFILRHPDFQQIFLYEPIPKHFCVCTKFLSKYTKVTLKNSGVGNSNENITLFEDGVGSKISEKGTCSGKIVKLDDDLQNVHPTFVKMDVEGFELEALKGMTRILKEDKPKLAICVYHKPLDILEIPEFIKSINPQYKFRLRQYMYDLKTDFELVLYAY